MQILKQKAQIVVWHCTGNTPNPKLTGSDIARYHTSPTPNGRGWKVPGYHAVIRTNGKIDILVDNDYDSEILQEEITNGVRGINYKSIHIAYIGGLDPVSMLPHPTITTMQYKALAEISHKIQANIPGIEFYGHNHFSNKACPCFNWQDFKSFYNLF
jgi:hypothetical protein